MPVTCFQLYDILEVKYDWLFRQVTPEIESIAIVPILTSSTRKQFILHVALPPGFVYLGAEILSLLLNHA